MAKYKVTVLRTDYSSVEVEVEAVSQLQAEYEALKIAGDLVFERGNAEYEVEDVVKV